MICSREGILEVTVNTSNSNNSLINSINFIVILNRLCNKNIDFRYAEAKFPVCRENKTDLPKWLDNKPIYFTKHWIEKNKFGKRYQAKECKIY